MILLLTYSCVYVPVEVAFLDYEIGGRAYKLDKFSGLTVDFLFFCDIIINFISAYEIPGSNSFEVRLSVLAKEYVLSWFFIDRVMDPARMLNAPSRPCLSSFCLDLKSA